MTIEALGRNTAEPVMKDFYALLRITPEASKLDVINAYRRAKLAFRKDSLAVYSLYDENDLEIIRGQIDQAYAVLSDRDKRLTYDVQHGHVPVEGMEDRVWPDEDELPTESEKLNEAGANDPSVAKENAGSNVVHLRPAKKRDYDPDLERQMQTAEVFSGMLLRDIREYRGVDLQNVAAHTRISMVYLQAIEDEDVAALPAKVYLKGYVGQYAAELGLEPHRVVQGYPPLSED